MAEPIGVTVTLKGGLFGKDVPRIVQRALVAEVLVAVDARVKRGGKGLGAQRNTITEARNGLELEAFSTRIYPRTRGTSWVRKNVAIVKSMAPRVIRKAADRIAAELG